MSLDAEAMHVQCAGIFDLEVLLALCDRTVAFLDDGLMSLAANDLKQFEVERSRVYRSVCAMLDEVQKMPEAENGDHQKFVLRCIRLVWRGRSREWTEVASALRLFNERMQPHAK